MSSGGSAVATLAREAAGLLVEEDGEDCAPRRAVTLARALEALASHAEASERPAEAQAHLLSAEANLREAIAVLQPYFGRAPDLPGRVLQLVDARAGRVALADAHQRIKEALERCKLDADVLLARSPGKAKQASRRVSKQRSSRDAATDVLDDWEADTKKDAEEDRLELAEGLGLLREQEGMSKSSLEIILGLLEEQPRIDTGAVLQGNLGTRKERRAMRRIVASLVEAQEAEAATLRSDMLIVDDPEQVLGEGRFTQVLSGMATRMSGKEEHVEVRVALKRVRPGSSKKSRQKLRARRALLLEAERWQGLRHENIVRLLGTCVLDRRFYLMMDLCDMSLEDLLYETEVAESYELSAEDREAILRGVSRGLAYLHANAVIHHDLKPTNVLLSHDLGLVKLANFGLTQSSVRDNGIGSRYGDADDEVEDARRGKSLYMAPEVLQPPAQWTSCADIFSLAMIMWEMYHGEPPYAHVESTVDLEDQVLRGERPKVSRKRGGILPWMPAVIEQCWDHDAQHRPRASEVLQYFSTRGTKSQRRSERSVVEDLKNRKMIIQARGFAPSSGANVQSIRSLVEALKQDSDVRLRTLESLHGALRQEFEADEETEVLRNEARSRGLLSELHRVMDGDQDIEVLTSALWVLRYALSGPGAESSRKAAVDSYQLADLAQGLLQVYPEEAGLQSAACRVVGTFAQSSNRIRGILVQEMSLGKELLEAMRAHPGDADVQKNACLALQNLSLNDRNKEILGQDLNAGLEILTAMRAHEKDGDVQEFGCGALQNLALDEQNRVRLGQTLEAGGAALAAMRSHIDDGDIQENACGLLWNLAANKDNRVILGQELDAGRTIVATMEAHVDDGEIQNYACAALGSLARNNRNKEILVQEVGCGQSIAQAMRGHPTDAVVQEMACWALCNLADQRNEEILVQEVGIGKDVIAAMRAHPEDVEVLKYACGAIGSLAFENGRNKVIFGQELKVGNDLVTVLRAHRDNARIVEMVCWAVCNLALKNSRNQIILGQEAGLAKELVEAMRVHSDVSTVQKKACGTLWTLASSPAVKQDLLRMGAVDVITAASEKFPELDYPKGLLEFMTADPQS
ncbi:Protein kinase, putative [Hondaea fermentalgiana]|uniref:Protein kinase, putative n=1 Tax=Hondaea fermentalgiana TaxID=2315210 RepID=A0A2R5GT50_9STRA|nr:Protein kinase, putative [Hondaea fermentalgiana]|eukprot:GBG33765.1 Protein kinase, putative [Hondaea fermentalgiana]